MGHGAALFPAYAAALLGWCLAARATGLWRDAPPPAFGRPWAELGYALLAALAVIGVGQLWQRGLLLHETGSPLVSALNQALIFAPMFALLALRRQGPDTAWIPAQRAWARLLVGAALAALAVTVYALVRAGADAPLTVLARLPRREHLDEAVQVFCEDVTIAVLLARLVAAVRRPWIAVVAVAALFAAGHVPALLAQDAPPAELLWLLRDVALGVGVLAAVVRARDVLWFFPIHLALDLMQFPRISGA